LAAVEIASLLGARVIAAASTDEKLALCTKFGADDGINYSTSDFRARLKALAPQGVNVVYDPVGGALFQDALASTANLARYLIVGFAAGEVPQIPAFLLLTKQIAAMGIYWGGFMQENPSEARATVEELIGHVAAGRLKPHVSKTFSLTEAPRAMRHLLRREAAGKVVLLPR
jgi:NADPH2:quinone reductase